jgi:hypothetical protein
VRRIRLVGLIVALFAAHIYAATVQCSFSGGGLTSNCYGSGVSFTSNDSLNLYSAFGSASASPIDMNNGPLTAATTNGVGVQFTLGPGGTTMAGGLDAAFSTSHYLTREDNTADVWVTDGLGHYAWDIPGAYGPNFNAYAGQFEAPTAHVIGTEASGAWGDYLIGPTLGDGAPANGTVVINFAQGVGDVGFDISSVSGGAANTNFTAEMDAYAGSTLLGSYLINATGSGGICAALRPSSGADPVPCNDAPLMGYVDPNNSITKVVIYAKDATGDDGFMIGDLRVQDGAVDPAPEPADYLLIGGGCLLLSLYARKRFAHPPLKP